MLGIFDVLPAYIVLGAIKKKHKGFLKSKHIFVHNTLLLKTCLYIYNKHGIMIIMIRWSDSYTFNGLSVI